MDPIGIAVSIYVKQTEVRKKAPCSETNSPNKPGVKTTGCSLWNRTWFARTICSIKTVPQTPEAHHSTGPETMCLSVSLSSAAVELWHAVHDCESNADSRSTSQYWTWDYVSVCFSEFSCSGAVTRCTWLWKQHRLQKHITVPDLRRSVCLFLWVQLQWSCDTLYMTVKATQTPEAHHSTEPETMCLSVSLSSAAVELWHAVHDCESNTDSRSTSQYWTWDYVSVCFSEFSCSGAVTRCTWLWKQHRLQKHITVPNLRLCVCLFLWVQLQCSCDTLYMTVKVTQTPEAHHSTEPETMCLSVSLSSASVELWHAVHDCESNTDSRSTSQYRTWDDVSVCFSEFSCSGAVTRCTWLWKQRRLQKHITVLNLRLCVCLFLWVQLQWSCDTLYMTVKATQTPEAHHSTEPETMCLSVSLSSAAVELWHAVHDCESNADSRSTSQYWTWDYVSVCFSEFSCSGAVTRCTWLWKQRRLQKHITVLNLRLCVCLFLWVQLQWSCDTLYMTVKATQTPEAHHSTEPETMCLSVSLSSAAVELWHAVHDCESNADSRSTSQYWTWDYVSVCFSEFSCSGAVTRCTWLWKQHRLQKHITVLNLRLCVCLFLWVQLQWSCDTLYMTVKATQTRVRTCSVTC